MASARSSKLRGEHVAAVVKKAPQRDRRHLFAQLGAERQGTPVPVEDEVVRARSLKRIDDLDLLVAPHYDCAEVDFVPTRGAQESPPSGADGEWASAGVQLTRGT